MVELIAAHPWGSLISGHADGSAPESTGLIIKPLDDVNLFEYLTFSSSDARHRTGLVEHRGDARLVHVAPGVAWRVERGARVQTLPDDPDLAGAIVRDISGIWRGLELSGPHVLDILEAGSAVNWRKLAASERRGVVSPLALHRTVTLLSGDLQSATLLIDTRIIRSFWRWLTITASAFGYAVTQEDEESRN